MPKMAGDVTASILHFYSVDNFILSKASFCITYYGRFEFLYVVQKIPAKGQRLVKAHTSPTEQQHNLNAMSTTIFDL